MLALEKRHGEFGVVEIAEPFGAHADEGVERAPWLLRRQETRPAERLQQRAALPAEPALRRGEVVDALHAAQSRLHGPLPGDVGAKAQRGQKLEALEVFGGVIFLAAEKNPAR